MKQEYASANHAEIRTRCTAQFLRLVRVAAGTRFGAFHQVARNPMKGGKGRGEGQKTEDLRKKLVHDGASGEGRKVAMHLD